MVVFRRRRPDGWNELALAVEGARVDVAEKGYCAASWQSEVVALAAPLEVGEATYVINLSLSTAESVEQVAKQFSPALLDLVAAVRKDIARGSLDA